MRRVLSTGLWAPLTRTAKQKFTPVAAKQLDVFVRALSGGKPVGQSTNRQGNNFWQKSGAAATSLGLYAAGIASMFVYEGQKRARAEINERQQQEQAALEKQYQHNRLYRQQVMTGHARALVGEGVYTHEQMFPNGVGEIPMDEAWWMFDDLHPFYGATPKQVLRPWAEKNSQSQSPHIG